MTIKLNSPEIRDSAAFGPAMAKPPTFIKENATCEHTETALEFSEIGRLLFDELEFTCFDL